MDEGNIHIRWLRAEMARSIRQGEVAREEANEALLRLELATGWSIAPITQEEVSG